MVCSPAHPYIPHRLCRLLLSITRHLIPIAYLIYNHNPCLHPAILAMSYPFPISLPADSSTQGSNRSSSAPQSQSPPDMSFKNHLHLDMGTPSKVGNGASVTASLPITPAESNSQCDVSFSDGRSPRSSVFSSSVTGDEGPSPRSITSLPLPGRSQPAYYRIIRRFSNSPAYQDQEPFWFELSEDDPLYWVVAARQSRSRDSDVTDLELQQQPLQYIIAQVPKTLHDEQKRSGLRVTVDITRVINGTWYGRDAVYIGLVVNHFERKVPSTKIKIEVATGGLGDVSAEVYMKDPTPHQPTIVRIAPKKHYGSAIPVDQSTEVGIEGNVAPMSPVGGGLGLKGSLARTTNVSLERRQTIVGNSLSEPRQSIKTIFQIDAIENDVTKDGVYSELPVGMIIETKGKPIVVTVDVEPKQKVFDSTFRYVATKYFWNVPIYLDAKDWGLDGLPADLTREMSLWDSDIQKKLINYSVDYETVSWLDTVCGRWVPLHPLTLTQVLFGE